MAKLPKFTLAHNEQKKKWELKSDGTGDVVKRFAKRPMRPKAESWRRPSARWARSRSRNGTAKFKKSAPIRAAWTRAPLKADRYPELGASLMAVAAQEMVVDHAHALHEGVHRGRSAEAEAVLL